MEVVDDELVDLGHEEAEADRRWKPSDACPLGTQATVERSGNEWAELWEEGREYTTQVWPDDDLKPPRLTGDDIDAAAASFPPNTGLGADNVGPRGVRRLSKEGKTALADLLNEMEDDGNWADILQLILIVLLDKSDGGKRPIGLFPTIIRIWMRARARMARKWEKEHADPAIHAGEAMGAQRAAWQIAFQAENAHLTDQHYAQALLDLVKCFEKIPHKELVAAANKHN